MAHKIIRRVILISSLFCICCNKDAEIKRLLKSHEPYENVKGAYKAMKSEDLQYVPLLLKTSGRQGATTALQFKGVTVYEEDMYALRHLLKVKPPNPITDSVDSVNIKFFINYWQKQYANKNFKNN